MRASGPLWVLVCALGIAVAAGTARADTITYTVTGTFASTIGATLDGNSVAGQAFTFSFVGDTTAAAPLAADTAVTALPVTGTFDIGGTVGAFEADDSLGSPLSVGWDGTNVVISYANLNGGDNSQIVLDGVSTDDPSYNGLNATSGPLSIISTYSDGTFPTTADGDLALAPGDLTGVTFTAAVATPEPSVIVLLGIGLAGMALLGALKLRRSQVGGASSPGLESL